MGMGDTRTLVLPKFSWPCLLNYFFKHKKLLKVNANIKKSLNRLVTSGELTQVKGQGASGSFRLGEKETNARPKLNAPGSPAPKVPKAKVKKASPKKKTVSTTKKTASPKKVSTRILFETTLRNEFNLIIIITS